MRATSPTASGETFERGCRIRRRHEFLRIQGKGQRVHSRRFVFQFVPGVGPESRIGITVSKKVGNAVVRNRIKRWVREAFRRHPELRPGAGDARRPYDLVITAKRDAEPFSWHAVHDELVQQLTRYLAKQGAGPGSPPGAKGGPRPPERA